MSTLYRFPTLDAVRALTSPEDLAGKIESIAAFVKEDTIATYTGELSPDMLHAWADFTSVILKTIPDAKMGSGELKITRQKTRIELENYVLDEIRSDRYYHPERYPDDYRPTMSDPDMWEDQPNWDFSRTEQAHVECPQCSAWHARTESCEGYADNP